MKKVYIIFTTLLFLISCNQKQELAPYSKNKETKFSSSKNIFKDSTKVYLSEKQLLDFIKKTEPFEIKEKLNPPFNTFKFNKVIAYDYEGVEEPYGSVFDINHKFIDIIESQKELTKSQTLDLINFLTNTKTYGGSTAACFNPHLGFVFFQNNNPVFHMDICLDCNYLISSQEIPAQKFKKVRDGNGTEVYSLIGFSNYGKDKIMNLGKQLNLYYGSIKYQTTSNKINK